jgi:hypothetical protein
MIQEPPAQQRPARHGPRRFSTFEMKKVGVELLGSGLVILLRCTSCDSTWSPKLVGGRNLPHGYWRCPKGCNK